MSRFKQGDWVIFNDTGLESCYGQSHTLQHMKTLVLQITEVDPESMTSDEPTHLVKVNNEAINTFMLTDWDFDHYEGQEIGDSEGWDSQEQPIKPAKKMSDAERKVLEKKAEEFNKVLIELITREAKLRDQIENELARKKMRGTNPNQIIADDFYGAPLKKGEIKW